MDFHSAFRMALALELEQRPMQASDDVAEEPRGVHASPTHEAPKNLLLLCLHPFHTQVAETGLPLFKDLVIDAQEPVNDWMGHIQLQE